MKIRAAAKKHLRDIPAGTKSAVNALCSVCAGSQISIKQVDESSLKIVSS